MYLERTTRWPQVPVWVLLILVIFLSLVGLAWWLGDGSGDLCLFRKLTTHPCPTCGTTRLVVALLHGDTAAAAAYNPLVFAILLYAVVHLMFRAVSARRLKWISSADGRRWAIAALIAALLLNWCYLLAHV